MKRCQNILILMIILVGISFFFNYKMHREIQENLDNYFKFLSGHLLSSQSAVDAIIENKSSSSIADIVNEATTELYTLDNIFDDSIFVSGADISYADGDGEQSFYYISMMLERGAQQYNIQSLLADGRISDAEVRFLQALSDLLVSLRKPLESDNMSQFKSELKHYVENWHVSAERNSSNETYYDLLERTE